MKVWMGKGGKGRCERKERFMVRRREGRGKAERGVGRGERSGPSLWWENRVEKEGEEEWERDKLESAW